MSAGSFWRSASRVTTSSPRAARKPEARPADWPALLPVAEDPDARVGRGERAQRRQAAVGRAVVDVEDLPGDPERRERGADLAVQHRQVLLLVVERNDDRQARRVLHPAYQTFQGACPAFQSSFRCSQSR